MLAARKAPVGVSRGWLPLACGLLWAVPSRAAAYSVAADVSVIGQGYELPSADLGAPGASRRRVTSYLGLSIDGLGRKDADGLPAYRDQLSLTVSLRVDADFGDFACNIGRTSPGSPLRCADPEQGLRGVRTDPELQSLRPELLLGYIEGRGLGGWVDVRLGRQLLWDQLELRGLDGAWLAVRTPIYMAIEGFAGVSPTAALGAAPPLYGLDGTSRSLGLAPDDPLQQVRATEPTFGATLRLSGLRDLQARLSYRQTRAATIDPSPAGCVEVSGSLARSRCAPSSGTIEERLSYTMHGRWLDGRLHALVGLRYDLLTGRFDDAQLGLRATLRPGQRLGIEYRYSAPTWDGDSIWNVFATQPYHQLQADYAGKRSPGQLASAGVLSWQARAQTRLFRSQGLRPGDPVELHPTVGGDVGVGYRRLHGLLRLGGSFDGGYGGLRGGADVSGRLLLLRDRLGLEGRAMYIYWADDQRDSSHSHGASLQAGVRLSLVRGALLHLLAEENVNRFYRSQLRLLAMLDLSFLLGPQASGGRPPGLLAAGFGDFPSPGLQPGVF